LLGNNLGCDIVATSSRSGYGYKELQASIIRYYSNFSL
jgi:hypothetical protein